MEVRISIPVGRRSAGAAEPVTRCQRNSAKRKTEETKRVTEGAFAEKKSTAVRNSAIDLKGPSQMKEASPSATVREDLFRDKM